MDCLGRNKYGYRRALSAAVSRDPAGMAPAVYLKPGFQSESVRRTRGRRPTSERGER